MYHIFIFHKDIPTTQRDWGKSDFFWASELKSLLGSLINTTQPDDNPWLFFTEKKKVAPWAAELMKPHYLRIFVFYFAPPFPYCLPPEDQKPTKNVPDPEGHR